MMIIFGGANCYTWVTMIIFRKTDPEFADVSQNRHRLCLFSAKRTQLKSGMLKKRYAKNTYGPKCQNTHGPKLWLLDTWAWAHDLSPVPDPGPMCLSRCQGPWAEGPRPVGGGSGTWAQGPAPHKGISRTDGEAPG